MNKYPCISTHPKDNNHYALYKSGVWHSPCVYQKAGVISEEDCWVWFTGRVDDVSFIDSPTHYIKLEVPEDE